MNVLERCAVAFIIASLLVLAGLIWLVTSLGDPCDGTLGRWAGPAVCRDTATVDRG